MFTQAWFWLMVAAVFFVMNVEAFSSFTHFPGSGSIGAVTILAIVIWFIFALFCADHWYEPIVAIVIGLVLDPIPYMINRHLNTILGFAGMVIAPLCVIVGYVVMF